MGKRNWSPGQGQGAGTARKVDGFGAVFDVSLGISKAATVALRPYWHIDLNAGCGWNDKANDGAGCEGSPVVFLHHAVAAMRPGPVRAYFCDINAEAVQKLRAACLGLVERLSDSSSVTIKATDNADFLREMAAVICEDDRPEYALGTCLCDPNAFRQGLPLDELARFLAMFPRIDLILNLNVSLFARVRACKADPRFSEGFGDFPDPSDVIGLQPLKRQWFVRNPSRGGRGERFVTYIGRNLETKRSPFKDFFPLDSCAGQEIVRKLTRVQAGQLIWYEDLP